MKLKKILGITGLAVASTVALAACGAGGNKSAKDDKTLVIELDTPVPFFESLMAFPSFFPVNEEFYNKCGDKFATTVDTILCNGAFKVTSYEPYIF